jgi:hypothetical protein
MQRRCSMRTIRTTCDQRRTPIRATTSLVKSAHFDVTDSFPILSSAEISLNVLVRSVCLTSIRRVAVSNRPVIGDEMMSCAHREHNKDGREYETGGGVAGRWSRTG